MRARYDENGKLLGFHNMVFDDIPDDYQMKTIFPNIDLPDLSFLGVMKYLRDIKAAKEFEDNSAYSAEILSSLALDYLNSALYLQRGIVENRQVPSVSLYLIPCAYLCRHSVELKLKECLTEKKGSIAKTHSFSELWDALDEKTMPHFEAINEFIRELAVLDENGMALRFGVSVKLEPLKEEFQFSIDALLDNTKFFFNVVDEHVICKYRYHSKG